MAPDVLRRLDRWIGTPLCWILSLARQAKRASGLSSRRWDNGQGSPRRILFVQLAEAGSMVLAVPALRWAVDHSGAQASFLTLERNRAALALTGSVPAERIMSLRTDSLRHFAGDLVALRRKLEHADFDTVVDLELFSRITAAGALLSGIRRRVGFHDPDASGATWRGDLYTHPVAYRADRHMSANYLALCSALLGRPMDDAAVAALPVARPPLPADLHHTRQRVDQAFPGRLKASPLLLVNPNASEMLPQRRWPEGHFVALVSRLLERHPQLHVLLIGSAQDARTTAAIRQSVDHPRCADLAGELDLPQLHALFTQSSLLVSNDSGPAHFATLAGLHVVVLFGPESPHRYRPLGPHTVLSANLPCSPCVSVDNQRRSDCADNRCMREIHVDRVLAAVEAELDPQSRATQVVRLHASRRTAKSKAGSA